MTNVSTFYFSRIIGRKTVNDFGERIGKVLDLIVEFSPDYIRPKVVAVILKTKDGVKIFDFSKFKVDKVMGQYVFNCNNPEEMEIDNIEVLFIGKNIQDRQLVDMDGRKLVRVNDVRMAILSNGTYLVAVDVGIQGLFRRLGVAKLFAKIVKIFKASVPSHLILWEDVETVDLGHAGIKLSKDYSNLSKLHPSDLADIIEELDRHTQIAIFSSLDQEKAADVLEELEPDVQKAMIQNMSISSAADLLEKMPADEAADLLDELSDDQAEALLAEMETEASTEVRELMDYPDNSVGSIMTTDFIHFNEEDTVAHVIEELREQKPDPEAIYYIYVVNSAEKLLATVSLRDIIVSDPNAKLKEIMAEDVIYVYDTDKIASINEIISKYSLLAVPVVDDDEVLTGVVVINDVVFNLLRARRKR
jgi:CBS domain-containing protein/sporulation protein YlmC with PRC-barrel domain